MCNSYLFQLNVKEIVPILYSIIGYVIIFSEKSKIPQIQLLAIFFIIYYYFKNFFYNFKIKNDQVLANKNVVNNTNWTPIHLENFNMATNIVDKNLPAINSENEINCDENNIPQNDVIERTDNFVEKESACKVEKNEEPFIKSNWLCCSSWSWCGAIG
jgi:hypothetical protein